MNLSSITRKSIKELLLENNLSLEIITAEINKRDIKISSTKIPI